MDNQLRVAISNNFRNTDLGIVRIKKNLNLLDSSISELEAFLKEVLLSTPMANIETRGKNYYFKNDAHQTILTVNSGSLTIITAKRMK